MATFSVITPVLNGARFIGAAIDSVTAQSNTDWEMIVVDGASTDDTAKIVADKSSGDKRIRLLSEPDQGMYDALLKGVDAAQGEWICWLNSDDLYTPWAFSSLAAAAQKDSPQWVSGYPACWDEHGGLRYVRPLGAYSQKKIAAGWHHQNLLGNLQQESIFFRRSLFEKLEAEQRERIRAMRLAGDFLLWRFFAEHAPLMVIPTVLGGFRRHQENMSAQQHEAYMAEVLSTDPFTLPAPLSRLTGYAYRLLAARAAIRLSAEADKSF
ncbi:glycosyltransferase family 2 protein [Hyphococcus sp.]|uniref:glycosyltransferase family 2 protein n=2 Tax=Hyphococcus sp. TaxID=2038636 RepID=UPI0035C6671A